MADNRRGTPPRVEITRNTPLWVTSDCGGRRSIVLSEILEPVFWVTVFEDGGELLIWDGGNYEDAIIAAEEAAQDWGAMVWDMVTARVS